MAKIVPRKPPRELLQAPAASPLTIEQRCKEISNRINMMRAQTYLLLLKLSGRRQ